MQTRSPMRREVEKGHTFTFLLTSLLVLLAACPNGTNGDNLKSIPEGVELTGYSDIQILKDTAIVDQSPEPSNLPTEGITFTYSIDPELPAGLTLNPTTGVLSGTPTTLQAAANYTITATAQGLYIGTVESTISIVIGETLPTEVELTGYSDIQILKDTAIVDQSPKPSNLPTEGITFTYSINPELPAGLTLNPTTGVLSGTPTTPQAAANYTITATPQGHYSGTVESTISIGIGETLPTAVTLTGYTAIGTSEDTPINAQTPTLTGLPTEEGFTYTYSIDPEIPAGLTLNPTTGTLSGTPTTPQAATVYTITATFQGRYIGTVDTTISIRITGDVPEEVELTGYSDIQILKDTAIVDQSPEPSNLPAGGITFTYSISPELPAGLTLNPTTGVLSGTPTTPQAAANYTITATPQGLYSGTVEFTISIVIGETLPETVTLTGYTTIDTSKDTPISAQTPTLTGLPTEEGITYTYSINPELPAGLTLNPTTGELSGTPTTPQVATVYTITATFQGRYIGTVDTTISIRITGDVPEEVELTGYSDIQILKDTAIVDQSPEPSNLPAGGIDFTYSISPELPAGLTLNPTTGVLSGTPTTPQAAANYTITATAQGLYSGTVEFTISIVIGETLPTAVTLNGYTTIDTSEDTPINDQTPTLTGLPTGEGITYTYSINPEIPAGLILNPTTGTLSGTPTTPQVATVYTITATFQGRYIGTVDTTISIRITGDVPEEVELTGYSDIQILKDTAIVDQSPEPSNLPAGGIDFTYSISPELPAGLTLNPTTGTLSGTPTTPQAAANYTITATAQGLYSGTVEFTISIVIGETLPTAVTLNGYTAIGTSEDTPINAQTPTLTGLPTEEGFTYTYSIDPEIPAGLTLNPTTGELSGTPTTPQVATVYTITATFQGRYIGTVDTTISIRITGDVPEDVALTGYSDIQILKDTTIADQSPEPSNLPAEGITFTYSISPDLPTGLVLDEDTGVLSGTPTTPQAAANYTITAMAQGHYIGSKEVTISTTVYKVQATDKAHLSTLIDAELQDAADGNVNLIDTSLVTDMIELFKGKTTFNEDISAWNVSNVTDMTSMFHDATSFNEDISAWNVSNVTDMVYMFYNATSFNQNLNDWDVSNVTDMTSTFYNAKSFNQNLNDWDVSNVGFMEGMFYDATSFNQDLNNWDVSNVAHMASMFNGATSFNGDITQWDTAKLSVAFTMFAGATSFNQDISVWAIPMISDIGGMFAGATSFNQDLESWGQYIPDGMNMGGTFANSGVENPPSWYTR